jgi:hypothetical protein
MYFYQYILIVGFLYLFTFKGLKVPAICFLFGWSVYSYAVIGNDEVNYYALSATIEFTIAFILNSRYRFVSYIGYWLVLLNFFGFVVHDIKTDYPYYDIVYAVSSIIQFLLLLARTAFNGLTRLHRKHFVVRAVNFDSRGAYDRMCKNTQTKSSYR